MLTAQFIIKDSMFDAKNQVIFLKWAIFLALGFLDVENFYKFFILTFFFSEFSTNNKLLKNNSTACE